MMQSRWTFLFLAGSLGVGCGTDDTGPKDPGNQAVPSAYDEDAVNELPEGSPDDDHDGWTIAQGDCDDNDGAVHPDQEELCDLKDNDCDAEIDEGFDMDGDGHLPMSCAVGDDCDDTNSRISPSATEIPYDGIDQDCSGADSLDADNDGFDSIDYGGNDCDDTDGTTYPGAPEIAKDGLDQDCDGEDSLDEDLDGYDDIDYGGRDCDDADPTINPGAFDWFNDPDEIDSDCDGSDGVATDMNDGQMVLSGKVSQGDYLGYTVDTCDLNSDGYDDLIVGAPLADRNRGEVSVYFGSGHADWTGAHSVDDADIVFSGQDIGFGLHLRCGDLDGDGAVDLAISRGEYGVSYDQQIHLFYGGSTWASAYEASDAHATLSLDLGASGSTVYSYSFELADLDDDGDDELFFFAPTDPALSGIELDDAIWIVSGGNTLSGAAPLSDVVDRRIYGGAVDAFTGMSVEPDMNGDGKKELVLRMGAAVDGTGATAGEVYFLSGMPAASDTVASLAWASIAGTTGVDSATGTSGSFLDVDGDGARDLVLGVPLADAGSRTNVGELVVISDIETALTGMGLDAATLASLSLTGGYSNGLLGIDSYRVGDLDGDGHDELFAVEPGAGTGGRGRSTVLSGALVTAGEEYIENARMIEFTHPNGYTGVAASVGAADFDADGHPDYWIAAPFYGQNSAGTGTNTGRVYLFTSSSFTNQVF